MGGGGGSRGGMVVVESGRTWKVHGVEVVVRGVKEPVAGLSKESTMKQCG